MKIRKFSSLLEYLLVIIIIIQCGTPYEYAVGRDFSLSEMCAVVILILFFIRVNKINQRLLKKYFVYMIPYFILTVLYMIVGVQAERMIGYMARFFVMLPISTLLFCQYIALNRPYQLLMKYVNVMVILSIISLFFWLFGSQLGWIRPNGSFIAHWGTDYPYPSYYGLYFERQHATLFGQDFGLRNQGIFCEGPMYSLNLIFSIAICVFLFEKKERMDWTRLGFLIVALITTFTTTGFILLILIFILRLLRNGTRKLNIVKLTAIMIGAPLAVWGISRIFIDKSTSVSWMIRMDDFYAGLSAWLENPIFGNGWSDQSLTIQYMSSFRGYNTGYSNTVMQILSQGGLCLLSVYALPIGALFIRSQIVNRRDINSLMIIFILEFIFTIFTYFMLMMFFISLFYALLINDTELNKAYHMNINLGLIEDDRNVVNSLHQSERRLYR